MAVKSWTLTDVENHVYLEELSLSSKDVPGAANGLKVSKRTLRGGLSDGVDEIRVDNGEFSFVVLPTRGMGLWKAWLGELEIGWKSPVRGPVHPKFVPIGEPSGLGWLDGFDELLPRCGLVSNGAPVFDDEGKLVYPLHGRIANKPAHKVEIAIDGDAGTVSVTGVVEETRFHFTKLRMTSTVTTKIGQPGLSIRDEVENFSTGPTDIQMLYHFNFGDPILDGGARVVAPIKTLVPRNDRAAAGIKNWDSYAPPEPQFEEQVYFMELLADEQSDTRALLKNAHGTQGVSLHFNKSQLPWFTVWKNTTSLEDGLVTGIEPGTNFPNPRGYEEEQGRIVNLAGGGKATFDLRLEVHKNSSEVESAAAAIAKIQGDTEPKIHDVPQKGWCDDA